MVWALDGNSEGGQGSQKDKDINHGPLSTDDMKWYAVH